MCIKKKKIVFGISLVMMIGFIIPSIYAQNFQVTPIQLKQTNILFNRLNELEIQDSLNTVLCKDYEQIIKNLEIKDTLNQKIISDLNLKNASLNISLTQKNEDYIQVSKQRDIITYISGTLCVIVALLILL